MEGAAPGVSGPEKAKSWKPDNLAVPKHCLQAPECLHLRICAKDRHDHDAVRDDKVEVRGRRRSAMRVENAAGAGDPDDFDRVPLGVVAP